MNIRIAWGITGAGGFINETVALMKEITRKYNLEVHVYLSKEAKVVLNSYKLLGEVKESFTRMSVEKGPNVPFLPGKLHLGTYKFFLIAPATANTVAKIAHCIADSLITNSAAQAIKADIPVYIFPVDQKKGEAITKLPKGKNLKIRIRGEDVENVEKLGRMRGIIVLSRIEELEDVVKMHAEYAQ